jgi:hypothetical protein
MVPGSCGLHPKVSGDPGQSIGYVEGLWAEYSPRGWSVISGLDESSVSNVCQYRPSNHTRVRCGYLGHMKANVGGRKGFYNGVVSTAEPELAVTLANVGEYKMIYSSGMEGRDGSTC